MNEQMNSADLLALAQAIYRQGRLDYRDTLLKIGETLHEYVLAFLREADGLHCAKRHENEILRQNAIKKARETLGTSDGWVRTMIVTAMVPGLLGGGKIGDLELFVSGMPSFETGENAVVFVEKSGAYQVVVGLG